MREKLRAQLMTALYRSGRQSDALQSFDAAAASSPTSSASTPARRSARPTRPSSRALGGRVPAAPPGPRGKSRPAPSHRPRCRRSPGSSSAGTPRSGRCAPSWRSRSAGRGPRHLLVTGMAGVGKTALAVHVAHAAAGTSPTAGSSPSCRRRTAVPAGRGGVLATLLRDLGEPLEESDTTPPDAAEQDGRRRCEDLVRLLRARTAGRQLLVVLDGAAEGRLPRPAAGGSPGRRGADHRPDQAHPGHRRPYHGTLAARRPPRPSICWPPSRAGPGCPRNPTPRTNCSATAMDCRRAAHRREPPPRPPVLARGPPRPAHGGPGEPAAGALLRRHGRRRGPAAVAARPAVARAVGPGTAGRHGRRALPRAPGGRGARHDGGDRGAGAGAARGRCAARPVRRRPDGPALLPFPRAGAALRRRPAGPAPHRPEVAGRPVNEPATAAAPPRVELGRGRRVGSVPALVVGAGDRSGVPVSDADVRHLFPPCTDSDARIPEADTNPSGFPLIIERITLPVSPSAGSPPGSSAMAARALRIHASTPMGSKLANAPR
ncbi:hypothetical protein LV779_13570 [Streptomyces thinghirensis]|nr:hypothetical protein [Streptomyces thinghirensis]